METTTIKDLLDEMTYFVKISQEDLLKAEASKITNKNNPAFRELLNHWVYGRYDESPELLVQRLTALL